MMKKPAPEFDQDGYILNANDWTPTLAHAIAANEGIDSLSDDHWKVIEALRERYFETGSVPAMRNICREAGLEEHCVSDLLEDPRRAWRIAGLPNPGEEAKAYIETSEIR